MTKPELKWSPAPELAGLEIIAAHRFGRRVLVFTRNAVYAVRPERWWEKLGKRLWRCRKLHD